MNGIARWYDYWIFGRLLVVWCSPAFAWPTHLHFHMLYPSSLCVHCAWTIQLVYPSSLCVHCLCIHAAWTWAGYAQVEGIDGESLFSGKEAELTGQTKLAWTVAAFVNICTRGIPAYRSEHWINLYSHNWVTMYMIDSISKKRGFIVRSVQSPTHMTWLTWTQASPWHATSH